MRNSIDKEAYKLLFIVLFFFIGVLTLITGMLSVNLNGFDALTLKISATLLLAMLGLTFFVGSEYYKMYNKLSYNSHKIKLWAGSAASFIAAAFVSMI
jgi:hypothetical protein